MSKQKKVRDYVGHMHIYIIISAIMILCAIAGSLLFGVEVAIEFKGGTILSYSYTGDVDTAQVETLAKGILNTPVTIQTGEALGDGSGKTMTISFSCAEGSFTPEVQGQLTTSIQGKYPDNQIELLESNLHRENAGYANGTTVDNLNPNNAELWSNVEDRKSVV